MKYPNGVPVVRYAGDEVAIVGINLASFDTVCVYECRFCSDGDLGLIWFRDHDAVEPLNEAGEECIAIAKELVR